MNEQTLFTEALERIAPQDRAAFLDQACQGDSALRARIERLLAQHEHAGDYLEARRTAAAPTVAPRSEAAGALIGNYKLLEEIGEGGMGTVWMAQQQEPVKRLVALKLIKAGMDSKQVIARLEAERQALALMDHPNIARVLDGGTTGTGRPYFVMDLVKGVPITQYCDDHRLTPRQRLELFIPVCLAVQHAHQKGIIHRDLKPSNVMVALYDGKPVPKVIDFGVAKAAGQPLTRQTLVTGFGHIVGTLEYMSPEQAEFNQLDIDTRSDIYSLGVLLYELLTGATPLEHQRDKESGFLEALRIIREEEVPTLSSRLSTTAELPAIAANRGMEPARLTKLVRGELDWIVMKALEKDRARRYETANGLAMDVERYLADEPVLACPPSAGYRLRKFARRYRTGVSVAALGLLFLVFLGSGIGWALRDRAARQSRLGAHVDVILGEVDRLEREQKWPEALLAARRAEAAMAGGESDGATAQRVRQRLKELAFVERLEQIRILRATWVEGSFDNAGAVRQYARAFSEYGMNVDETASGQRKPRPALAIPLAAALDDWMQAQRTVAGQEESGWKRLVAAARSLDPEPLRDRLRSSWGQTVTNELRDELRRIAQSIDVGRQHPATLVSLARTLRRTGDPDAALRLLRDSQHAYPGDFWLNFELGMALDQCNDHEGVIRFYTAAVSIRPNLAASHTNLGAALHAQGKLDESMVCIRRAIELDPRHAIAFHNLGVVLRDQNKLDEAIGAYRKAIELDPTYPRAYRNLGAALSKRNKLDEAIEACRTAIEIDPTHAAPYGIMGDVFRRQQKLDEAVGCYRKAIEIDPGNARNYNSLGALLCDALKEYAESVECFHKAIEIDPASAVAYLNLGIAFGHQNQLIEATSAFRKVVELDPKNGRGYAKLAEALARQKNWPDVVAAYQKLIELDPGNGAAHVNLGNALFHQGKLNEAVDAYRSAIEINPDYALAYVNLGSALFHLNEWDQAVDACRQAIVLNGKEAKAYELLGTALAKQRKLDDAIIALRQAIELDPNYAIARGNLGAVLAMQGKPADAIVALRQAIEVDPNYIQAYSDLGAVLSAEGKRDEAIAIYRAALDIDSKSKLAARISFNLAKALEEEGQLDETIAFFERAVELDPEFEAACNALAWLLTNCREERLRNPRRALEVARKAVDLAPQSDFAWQVMGWAFYRAADWNASIMALEKSCGLQNQPPGGDAYQWFFLAMAHWQLGRKDEAREWNDRAVQWMDTHAPNDATLQRFRLEAEELLQENPQGAALMLRTWERESIAVGRFRGFSELSAQHRRDG